ncbi:MAG: ATP-dependent DNA ligase [Actinomycetota bacterium]|nr:ATP-dependent DNA ligase [Actinomycetota bacterium]
MALPLDPPLKPMLAKLQSDIPTGEEWVYEPKWDGFRAIVFRDGDHVHIASRDQKPLERYFPELVPAFQTWLPERCVIDGEVIVTGASGLDFDALLQRIHPAESRITLLSEKTPASFVAFDMLALGDEDLRAAPLVERRRRLLGVLDNEDMPEPGRGTKVSATPQTSERDEAIRWLETLEEFGLDGVIAKQSGGPYVAGERVMVKIKQRRTADCVVGGYRLSKSKDGVGSLLLGLHDDGGTLHFVGHTSSFKAAERRALLEQLRQLEGGGGFEGGRSPGGPSRWNSGRELNWVPLEPVLVCEVSYDKMQGDRFRHASTFIRWRDDKKPFECTMDQVR